MGGLARIMADYMEVPYWSIASCAIVPALFYYIAVFLQVSLYSAKHNLGGLDKSEVPNLKTTFKKGWPFILPLVIMVFLFSRLGWDALRVGFSVCVLVGFIYFYRCLVKNKQRVSVPFKGVYHAFANAGRSMANIMPAACLAGIIMCSVNLTAIGLRLSSGLIALAHGNLFVLLLLCALCCLLMGVAVDLIVIYIIMAVMITPAMISLGVVPLAAHLFILYYTVVGLITPPVCVATYAASSIAQSQPFKTGFTAMRLGFVALVIPFVFAYKPELLFQGGFPVSQIIVTICLTLLAIITLSTAFEGYFFKFKIRKYESLILIAAGFLLLMKPWFLNVIGLGLVSAYIAIRVPLEIKKEKTV